MQLKALIVDDEPLARDLLRSMLRKHEDVAVIGECANGDDAVEALQDSSINLLFLDVQMPEMDGFDVIEEIGVAHLPPTIFVTAFQEHAVRAFDVQYSRLHVNGKHFMLRETITELNNKLDPSNFVRVRSAIVNVERIREVIFAAGIPRVRRFANLHPSCQD
jgi:DNA-binding LytR/AlgR family response regulator